MRGLQIDMKFRDFTCSSEARRGQEFLDGKMRELHDPRINSLGMRVTIVSFGFGVTMAGFDIQVAITSVDLRVAISSFDMGVATSSFVMRVAIVSFGLLQFLQVAMAS